MIEPEIANFFFRLAGTAIGIGIGYSIVIPLIDKLTKRSEDDPWK